MIVEKGFNYDTSAFPKDSFRTKVDMNFGTISERPIDVVEEYYKRKLKEDPNWKPEITQSNMEVKKGKNGEETYTIKTHIK